MDQNFESMSYNGTSGTNSGFGTESPSFSSGSTPNIGSPFSGNTVSGTGMTGVSGTAGMGNSSAPGSSAGGSFGTGAGVGSLGKNVKLNDQVVASDLLISAKTGVKAYADAITEAATPSVRSLLKRQLDEAIAFQDQISAYMTQKGWYNAYNVNQQILIDLNQTQNTLNQLNQ